MDTLIIVLFVLVIFIIIVCFENGGLLKNKKGDIIEGVENYDEYVDVTRRLSSQGLCRDENDEFIYPSDKPTCVGTNGYKLTFTSPTDKRSKLETILPTSDEEETSRLIEREVSLEYGDIVMIDGREDEMYIYRGIDTINLETHTEKIALFPYSHEVGPDNEKKFEYCYDENDGFVQSSISRDDCSGDNQVYFRPVRDSNLDLTSLSDNFKSISCTENDDGITTTGNGIKCFDPQEIKQSHCTLTDEGTGNISQIRPVSFWKSIYKTGNQQDINEQNIETLCEGNPTGHTWTHNSDLYTMGDSQRFAEIASQVERNSDLITGFNDNAIDQISNERSQALQFSILPESQAELERMQEEQRDAYLDSTCAFESELDENREEYHGNDHPDPSRKTINLYLCPGDNSELSATNIRENCSRSQMICDTNFAKDDPNINLKQINCVDGFFNYSGCLPSECTLPGDFHNKYQMIDGDTPQGGAGVTVNINNLKDMYDDTLKVRCANGYNGEPIISSCIENSELIISGCDENTCRLPDNTNGYTIPNADSNVTKETFNTNNKLDRSFLTNQDNNSNYLKCESPNNFHINSNSQNVVSEVSDFIDDFNNVNKELKNHTNYPSVTCDTPDEGGGYIFNLSGCYENKCLNPTKVDQNRVYETTVKPLHINDTEKIVESVNNKYEMFAYEDITSNNFTLTKNEINNKLKCGMNYTKEGSPDSTDESTKTIETQNIQCYNFYDYLNISDEENKQTPFYRLMLNDDIDQPEYSEMPADFSSFGSWLSENVSINRSLPFSVKGCLENNCKWPTQPESYDRPKIRSSNIESIEQYQTSDGRYKLGYKNIDPQSVNTAKSFVGYNDDGSTTLECFVPDEDGNCEDEPEFTNEEINQLNENISAEIRTKGQPTSLTSEQLTNVGRGGPFAVSRCWHRAVESEPPSVICNGEDCARENSECIADVSGCSQNECLLNEQDAETGTRITVETSPGVYQTVGGPLKENMNISFNVDKIRNITCDENYSKPNISPNDSEKPFGGGEGVENIKIKCLENLGTFTLENKCGVTECTPNTIDSIDGLIHLKDNSHDKHSVCPIKSFVDTHRHAYGDNLPTQINVDLLETIESEICSLSSSVNETIDVYNKNRYQWNGDNYVCGLPIVDNIENKGLSSVGVVSEKCNYAENSFDDPKRTVSGCQPKLCTLPSVKPIGYEYNSSIYPYMVNGSTSSTDIIVNRGYFQTVEEPLTFLENPEHFTSTNIPISCSEGYNGEVELSCEQNAEEYSGVTQIYNELTLSGCEINRCRLPDNSTDYVDLENGVVADGTSLYEPEYINSNIVCKTNSSRNMDTQILCESPDGVFSGIEEFCVENVCRIPETISMQDETHVIRVGLSDGTFPDSVDADDTTLTTYLTSVGRHKDPRQLYQELPSGSLFHNLSDLDISCCENCYGSSVLNCPTNETDLEISGCQEKYCRLPSFLDSNTMLYNFSAVSDKLEKLEQIQEQGITKEQLYDTFNHFSIPFSCSSFATSDGTTPMVECAENGQDFTLSGCGPLEHDTSRDNTNGSIIYSYYPSGCNIIKENAFIHISGAELFQTEEEFGSSITHKLRGEENGGPVEEKETGYYYKKIDDNEEFSEDPPNEWEENGWAKIPYHIHYEERDQNVINTKMNIFMDNSKQICDQIETCHGFNVIPFNAMSSELDAISKADARNDDGSVNIDVLREFIQNTDNKFLEMGTFKSEQKGGLCEGNVSISRYDFHNEWGGSDNTEEGNPLVYNRLPNGKDVVSHRAIPANSAVYFKKIIVDEPSGNGNKGFTNLDEP